MKVIVTLCGTGWPEWPSQVRTRALDLYNADEGVEFWDAVNAVTNTDEAIWGNWPRRTTLGGPALMAEFEEQIGTLGRSDRLALLLIYPKPSTLLADRAAGEQSVRLPSRGDLEGLYLRSLAGKPSLAQRVLRTAVFAADADPDEVRGVQELVHQRLFDSAFCLTDNYGGFINEQFRRRFYGLRVLIDMARGGHDGSGSHDFWPGLLRPGASQNSPVYVLRTPERAPAPEPSTRRSVEITAYFARQSHQLGQDSAGQSLKDLEALRDQIRERLHRSKDLLPTRPAPVTSDDPGRRLIVRRRTLLRDRLLLAETGEPLWPDRSTVDHWRYKILANLTDFFNHRRALIRDQQSETDRDSRRSEIEIDEKMRRAISAHQTGLTSNAYNETMKILQEVKEARAELAVACASTRDEIFALITSETDDAVETDPTTAERIRALPAFPALLALHETFRVTTANTVRWRNYTAGMVGPFSMIYLLLMLQVYGTATDPVSLLDVFSLGKSFAKLGLVVGGYGMAAGLAVIIYRRSRRRWSKQRDDIIAMSEEIARRLAMVADASTRYGKLAIEMSWLTLIEQQLTDVAREINEPLIDEAIRMLRRADTAAPLTGEEERAFENALEGRLSRTPVVRWIQVMLDRASPEPMSKIELNFEDDRSGDLQVSSRLGIRQPVIVTRASA